MAKDVRRALMIARAVGSPERQQAFDQWGGAPERWYHGTSKDVDFSKFKIGRHGAWFARDPQEASKYAEQNDSQGHRYEDGKFVPTNTRSRVIPVHLKLGKSHTGPMPDNFLGAQNYKKAQSEWFDQLRAQGYDSWTPEGNNLAVILKDPTQIKSAIGNRGTYDPNEADIGKAEGGPVDHPLTQDVYHGTSRNIPRFEDRADAYSISHGLGVHVARDPKVSGSAYFVDRNATGEGGNMMPLKTFADEKFYPIEQKLLPYLPSGTSKGPRTIRSDDRAVTEAVMKHAFKRDPALLKRTLMEQRALSAEKAEDAVSKLRAGGPWEHHGSNYRDIDHLVEDHLLAPWNAEDRAWASRSFRDDLIKKGYAGAKYINTSPNETEGVDDPTCYIVFNKPTSEGYYPLRSRFAAMNPTDKSDPDLLKARGGAVESKEVKRALMIARDQRALLRRVANIYPGPAGGMDPSPGGGGYSGPGGGKYIGPSRYADGGGVDDYGGEHRPPGPEDGAPLHDLTGQGRVYPDDIYGPNAARYYGHGDDPLDHGTMSIIRQFKGRPSAMAAIYRAVPAGITTAEKLADLEKAMAANMRRGVVPEGESNAGSVWYNKAHAERARLRALPPEPETKTNINPGDWVTINRQYAKDHGESTLRGKYKIIRKTVRADELYTDGNSIHEYGYWPRTQRADGGSVPPFKLYSGAAKVIAAKGQAKATPQQYAAMPGIKPDELKYSKFDTLGSKALPREEVIKHLEDNRLPIEETQLGGEGRNTSTKFSDKTLPGGQNYREVLLHLPETRGTLKEYPVLRADGVSDGRYTTQEAAERRAAQIDGTVGAPTSTGVVTGFRSAHWKELDVLAHVRMSDRKGPNGEKVLHVEEIQSDWGQQGRESGFKDPALEEKLRIARDEANQRVEDARTELRKGMPDTDEVNRVLDPLLTAHKKAYQEHIAAQNGLARGPYVDNTQKWTDLALKRVLHEAAHGGYDKIVVTPGDEQNKRYDLSSQVKNIQYYPDTKYLGATTHDNRGVEHEGVEPDDLSKHIGKEAADRILKQPLQRFEGRGKLGGEFYHELEGEGLKVGGEGMRGYYDNILPKRLQALAQQHDPQAKVNLHAHDLAAKPSDPFEEHKQHYADSYQAFEGQPHANDAELRDWARDFSPDDFHGVDDDTVKSAPLHSLDVTPQMRDSIKANGFNSFKRGGEVDDDPIKDWQWRPTDDVRNELQLDEIPSHVHKFGEFMDETARRAATQGLTPRDLIKAYAITRSSIGRGALPVSTVRRPKNPAYGFDALPEDTQGSLRPEGAMGHWLHTKMGQRYLDEAEAGRVDEEAVRDAIKSMGAFGLPESAEGKALRWAPKNLPGQEGRVSELIARAHRGQSSPEEWRGEMRVPGIAESKAGFFASMLGRGDQPTLDARQIILNTGQSTKKAAPYLSPKGAKEAAVNRLAGRQTELGLKHDKSMSPFYQHLTHHTIWDKVGNEQTTHDDLMQALRGAKDGGRQGYASGGPTNILGHPVARALITALGPNWVNPLDEAAQAAGMVPGELAHKLRMRVGDKADKLSTLAPQTDWAAHSVKLARAPLEPIRRIDAHEIARNKGTFIAGPGDRQITDAEIHGLNGVEFATPVRGHGGPFYPRGEAGRTGAAWASAQGPVSKQLGMAESAERLGSTPYHVPWSMSRGAVDSTPMMWELIANLLPHAKINKTGRAMIDRSIRSHVVDKEGTRPFRGAPSIASEEFPKWVGAMDLGGRYALMKALEKTAHIVKGFPEPAALRLAITEPEYVAPRSLTAGRVITQIDPKAGIIHDPEVPHPGYPKQFMKKGAVMGFERPAPLGLMFPKAWKTIAGDLDPEVAAVPNNVNRAFQMSNIYQPVTNEVADNLAAYFEREKGKPFKKGGGRVGHAPSGSVSRALDIARKINGR